MRSWIIKLAVVLIVGLLFSSRVYYIRSTKEVTDINLTLISFNQTKIELGYLQHQQPKYVIFNFKNEGKRQLLIQQVEASCGCTTPEWPRYPIKPGEGGEIKVIYDAKYPGKFNKKLTVFCNVPEKIVELRIKGEVQYPDSCYKY